MTSSYSGPTRKMHKHCWAINSIRHSIHFTIVKEADDQLAFLDVLIAFTEYRFKISV